MTQLLQLDSDLTDATEIFQILTVINEMGTKTNVAFKNYTFRESIQKVWQEKRFPRPRHSHNKPFAFPWSSGARDDYFNLDKPNLVLEHVSPISGLRLILNKKLGREITNGQEMMEFLIEYHSQIRFTIISKDEDNAITRAGFRSKLAPDEEVWGRYEAIGLKREDFCPLTEDARFPKK